MSKFGTFSEYPRPSLVSAEAALLTAWRSLERYHDDLVLVGGLPLCSFVSFDDMAKIITPRFDLTSCNL